MHQTNKRSTVLPKLNPGQIDLLELLYKYRFGTRQLLANSLGIKNTSTLHEKLEGLVRKQYVDRRYDKSARIQGVPAAYFLVPKGFKALQDLAKHEYITDQIIKASCRDKLVSKEFVDHTIEAYKHTQLLQQRYEALKAFMPREMSRYRYFPKHQPDAFLSLPSDEPGKPQRFFLDIVSDLTPRYITDRKVAAYNEHFETGKWDATKSSWPVVLLVADSASGVRGLQRSMRRLIDRIRSDMRIYTTTTSAMNRALPDMAIWSSVVDTNELVALEAIPVNP